MTAIPATPRPIQFPDVWNGTTRVALVVFGGLLVLQSSGELDPPKIAYLGVALVAALGTLLAVARAVRAGELVDWRLPLAATLLLGLLAASLPVALARDTPVIAWLRDGVSYGLFAFAVYFAVDLERSASQRMMVGLFALAGVLATLGFTLEWLARRDIIQVGLPWTPLPSGSLPSALFATASALALRGERRILWAVLAGALLGAFLLVGTRSRIPFIALPVFLALLAGRSEWRSHLKILGWMALSTVLVVSAVTLALSVSSRAEDPNSPPGSRGGVDVGELGERVESVGGLITAPQRDPSFQERIAQTRATWETFIEHPLLGAGPGHEISWTNFIGEEERGYYLDTPVMELAKFGVVGLAVAFVWIVAFTRFIRLGLRSARFSPAVLSLVGFAVVLLYSLPLSPPTHDKGTGLALIFLLALGIRAVRGAERTASRPVVS